MPALVAKLSVPNAACDAVAERAKGHLDGELLALSDDICTDPEGGYKETRSADKLTDALKAHGFRVAMGGGFATAFTARFRHGDGVSRAARSCRSSRRASRSARAAAP